MEEAKRGVVEPSGPRPDEPLFRPEMTYRASSEKRGFSVFGRSFPFPYRSARSRETADVKDSGMFGNIATLEELGLQNGVTHILRPNITYQLGHPSDLHRQEAEDARSSEVAQLAQQRCIPTVSERPETPPPLERRKLAKKLQRRRKRRRQRADEQVVRFLTAIFERWPRVCIFNARTRASVVRCPQLPGETSATEYTLDIKRVNPEQAISQARVQARAAAQLILVDIVRDYEWFYVFLEDTEFVGREVGLSLLYDDHGNAYTAFSYSNTKRYSAQIEAPENWLPGKDVSYAAMGCMFVREFEDCVNFTGYMQATNNQILDWYTRKLKERRKRRKAMFMFLRRNPKFPIVIIRYLMDFIP